ncbi:hypothetical protein ACH5RR_001659 [Cinchona calisaya]|uniref:Phospholipid/glycerol acyltransferase domain-containing protein n=1 Tax=Cinchona calisaya TaxID=153742 RepID=A0ABD3B4U3_9GENT
MEEALLKSSSLFPYFMLVAFEAGGLLRAILLFLAHPLVWFFSKKMRIKIMVFICLFGIKKDKFRIGRSVLPKFFLEDVGYEGFEMVMRHKRKVAFSDLPTVMVEGFLKDYLGVDAVMGRQVKVAHGYFVGLMEERCNGNSFLNEIVGQEKFNALVGFSSLGTTFSQQFFSRCKEIYLVNNAEKSKWHILPRDKYPRRLIFHDGRLAFRPTFFATFLMFLWVPFGFFLCIIRAAAALLLPYKIAIPILAFTGMKGSLSISFTPSTEEEKSKGTLYVCNHRTLLDPIYVSMALMKPLTAVTYSVSRISEMLSPIRTARLMRDRENDLKMMKEMLCQGDLVVCPEGTTCREPYLLRFSPLFAEITDDIVPVALDMQASMFYGTTASGLKCLDPLFFLLNPSPTYIVRFLDRLPTSYTCASGGKSRYEVANYVQSEIGKALGFECTSLTRKEKYMILAGNEGLSRPMLH